MRGKRLRKEPKKRFWAVMLLAAVCCLLSGAVWERGAAVQSPAEEPAPPALPQAETPPEPTAPREEERAEPWAPVPESAPVTDDYFDDAAFVGDSRTDGFRLYSGLDRGVYFCVTGETVASAVELSHWKEPDGTKIPLADAVAAAQCGKIYLMLGVNELGWSGTDLFRERAGALLARLRADHPQAAIAIQSLLPVTAAQDQKGTYVNNRRIQAYNQVWRELAEEGGYFYLDVAQALTGEDGCLPDAVSYDGVHLNREGCRIWLHYLRLHRVPAAEPAE